MFVMSSLNLSVCQKVLIFLSFLLIIYGILITTFYESIYQRILQSQLVLSEGTVSYKAWKETPIPLYTKFYFFDMLNVEDFELNHANPVVEERGPYTFRQVEKKVNITHHSNGTISYRRIKFWYFDLSLSVGNLTDTVTTLNMPAVGAAEFAKGDFLSEFGVSDMLATIEAKLFVRKSVGELLFSGYRDPILEIKTAMDEDDEYDYDVFDEYEDYEKQEYVEQTDDNNVPMDKFGWFYKRNGTSWADGDLSTHSGKSDFSLLGKIDTWNYRKTTDAYTGECGKVQGSADGLFAPGVVGREKELRIFSTDLCRPLTFSNYGSTSVHGIQVEQFKLSSNAFSNSTVCSANSCYNNNLPTGVQNVTQCKMKSPTFVSRPHFYLADSFYQQQFQYGIQPDGAKHDSQLWIEPLSSIPVRVQIRLQLNILLDKIDGIEMFRNVPQLMFPVLWFDSEAVLPESMASPLNMLVVLQFLIQACGACCASMGGVMFLGVALSGVRRGRKMLEMEKEKARNIARINELKYGGKTKLRSCRSQSLF